MDHGHSKGVGLGAYITTLYTHQQRSYQSSFGGGGAVIPVYFYPVRNPGIHTGLEHLQSQVIIHHWQKSKLATPMEQSLCRLCKNDFDSAVWFDLLPCLDLHMLKTHNTIGMYGDEYGQGCTTTLPTIQHSVPPYHSRFLFASTCTEMIF